MPSDPVSGGCGCALALIVIGVYIGLWAVWAFLYETGLVYPLGIGLGLWVLTAAVKRVRRS